MILMVKIVMAQKKIMNMQAINLVDAKVRKLIGGKRAPDWRVSIGGLR